MKKAITMKGFLCIMILLTGLFLWGCGNGDNETPSVDSINISISIDYPAKAKQPDLKTLPFRIEENSSVLQVVELYGNVNNMSILIDTTYTTLEGIDGVINHVTLKSGVWQYKINGELKNKSIDKVILKDGDHLELIYTKEPQ